MVALLAIAQPAPAQTHDIVIALRGGDLTRTLRDLMRQSGAELLFDPALLRGRRAPRLQGRFPIETALNRLLAGTDLEVRRAASGAWVIERRRAPGTPVPEILTAPDILVIGRQTQDLDIRRRETDIQPYQVATGEQINRAHRNNLDQFFRSRITANTIVTPPSLQREGATNSQIDLRGLGPEQTLILVDGRRLPSIPQLNLGFGQPDLNAIPLHAIDRVETLMGTAGGIYGFGALGGVVNVVMRHDYQGLELHGTSGISSRGDARRLALEAGIGHSFNDGRTAVSAYISASWEQRLREGQRGLTQRGREATYRFAPDLIIRTTPPTDDTQIYTVGRENLVLKPEYGGGSLGSYFTHLPGDFSGDPSALPGVLREYAGSIDLTPSADQRRSDIGSTPQTRSAAFTLRHRFDGGAEAYFDTLILRNRGKFRGYQDNGFIDLEPDSPLNPFQNRVFIQYAALPNRQLGDTRFSSDRYTGGMIFPVLHDWRAVAEATFGVLDHRFRLVELSQNNAPIFPSGDEPSDFNPFGNATRFRQSLAMYQEPYGQAFRLSNRYHEQSLKLAGTAFRTSAGAATLTIGAQSRTERIPSFTIGDYAFGNGEAPANYYDYRKRTSRVRSAYAELKAPLIDEDARIPLIRGLELQAALRHDRQRVRFSNHLSEDEADVLRAGFSSTAYTIGALSRPARWLMVRGSYAIGRQPPLLDDLVENNTPSTMFFRADPKRGNAGFIADNDYSALLRLRGSADLKPIEASTMAAGLILNPDARHAPRVTIDYSRIRRSGDVIGFGTSALEVEYQYPDRVIRAPLTDEDRAKGYTGGHVLVLDERPFNGGTFIVQTIDGRIDWNTPLAAGLLHIQGSATAQLRSRTSGPFVPTIDRVNARDGPLRWRANGGAEFSSGRTMIGFNAQYFSRYRITEAGIVNPFPGTEQMQGSSYIKSQFYVDLYASRSLNFRFAGSDREATIDFAIVNLFDHAPPYQTADLSEGPLYSLYGDPRQRRFELVLNARF